MHRFFYPGSLSGPEIELAGDEAHHLVRVLRLSAGDQVELFDGQGQAAVAEIVVTQKSPARLRIVSAQPRSRPRRPRVTLLTAAPKSERLRWLVEKATELGVDRLVLLRTHHSVVHPGTGKLEKLHAAVIAACKQCGRNDLMRIDPPQPWETVVAQTLPKTDRLFVATADGLPLERQRAETESLETIAVAIGPEGGWTTDEFAYATERGAIPVQLGPLVLRIETACLAATSVLRSWFATPQ